MYTQLIKPKNIIKAMLMIVTLLLVSVTLQTTFSSYVEPDYYDEAEYNVLLEDENATAQPAATNINNISQEDTNTEVNQPETEISSYSSTTDTDTDNYQPDSEQFIAEEEAAEENPYFDSSVDENGNPKPDYHDGVYYWSGDMDEHEDPVAVDEYGRELPFMPFNWTGNTSTAVTIAAGQTVSTNGWNRTGNVTINNNATLIIPTTMQGGTQTTITGRITINAGGRLIMNGGRITGAGTRGVAIHGGTFEMHGGEITGNTRSTTTTDPDNGGGVRIVSSNSRMYMTGGRIHNNSSGQGGGILSFQTDTTGRGAQHPAIHNVHIYLTGGSITNNRALSFGGGGIDLLSERLGATAGSTVNLTMRNVEVAHNTANDFAGGIQWNSMGTLIIEDSHIHNNFAPNQGGGLMASFALRHTPARIVGPMYIRDTIIENNWTNHDAGGIMAGNQTDVTISGSTIIRNNRALGNNNTGSGGGILRVGAGRLIIEDEVAIYNNTATDGGGVAQRAHVSHNTSGDLIIRDNVRITNNTASRNGGGVHWDSPRTFTLSDNVIISGNRAAGTGTNGGGGISASMGTVNMTGGTVGVPVPNTEIDALSETPTITVDSNRALNGGGVRLTGGTFNMTGGLIHRNVTTTALPTAANGNAAMTTGRGGGVFVTGGTFTSSAGENKTIEHNLAGSGGGVFVTGGTFALNNGYINDNNATVDGGGVGMTGGIFNLGTATLSGSIIDNHAVQNGGGAHLNSTNARFNFNGGIISDNEAGNHGGGAYLTGGVNAILDFPATTTAKHIVDNTALAGGGVFAHNGTFNFNTGGLLARNSATGTMTSATGNGHGGGVYLTMNGRFNAPGGSITHNRAPNGDGGGIFTENRSYTLVLPASTSYGNLTIGPATTFAANTARFPILGGPSNPGIIAPRVRNALVSSHINQHILNNDDVNYYFVGHVPVEPEVLIEKTSQRLSTQLPLPQTPTTDHGIQYTIRVSNIGNIGLTGLVVTDPLPTQLINPRYLELPQGATGAFTGNNTTGNILTVTLGDTLQPTEHVDITFISGIVARPALVQVLQGGADEFMNTATVVYPNNPDVRSQDIDSKMIENLMCPPIWDDEEEEWVDPESCEDDIPREIYLTITKTANPASGTLANPAEVELDDEIEFRIEIQHGPTSTALFGRDIIAHDIIPDGLSFNASDLRGILNGVERPLADFPEITYTVTGNRIDWTIDELKIRDSFVLIVPTTIDQDLTARTDFINTAFITYVDDVPRNPYKPSNTTYHRLNIDITVPFEFIKRDAVSLEALEGAYFHLYRENEDNRNEEDDDWESLPMATARSGVDGWVRFKGLTPGNLYRLVETQAPDGFYTPGGYWIISFDEHGAIETTRIGIAPLFRIDEDDNDNFVLINKRMSFEFIKTEEDGETPLYGAVFHVYKRNYDNTDWEDEPLEIVTSGHDGWVRLMRANLGQQYRLVEYQAPLNFQRPTGYWVVTIAANAEITFETMGDAPDVERNDDNYFFLINNPIPPGSDVPITGLGNNMGFYSAIVLVGAKTGLVFTIHKRMKKRADLQKVNNDA